MSGIGGPDSANHITYYTISINSLPLYDSDMPDENFCSSFCLEACDMGKFSSGAGLCLVISAVLGVEFEVGLCSRTKIGAL
jgi:hypothetical protein